MCIALFQSLGFPRFIFCSRATTVLHTLETFLNCNLQTDQYHHLGIRPVKVHPDHWIARIGTELGISAPAASSHSLERRNREKIRTYSWDSATGCLVQLLAGRLSGQFIPSKPSIPISIPTLSSSWAPQYLWSGVAQIPHTSQTCITSHPTNGIVNAVDRP